MGHHLSVWSKWALLKLKLNWIGKGSEESSWAFQMATKEEDELKKMNTFKRKKNAILKCEQV